MPEKNPPITPKWLISHIIWEDSINTQAAALDLYRQYRAHDIPVSGIIIDSPWELSYNDFNWDTARYPDPRAMIDTFKQANVRVILWLTGCINRTAEDVPVPKNPYFDYVREKGYVVNNGKTSVWWKGEGVHLDFTNPEAMAWWDKQLDKVFVDGIYGWKVDQGEATFADSLSLTEEYRHKGEDGLYYGDSIITSKGRISLLDFKHAYYDHMFDYTLSRNPAGMIMARPYSHQGGLSASIPKLTLGWCGDFSGDYEGLKLQIDNIYTSALVGFGALACEIGGFYNARSDKNQLIRYTQFAAMTTTMDNGGSNGAFTNHLPWYHDEETTKIYRYYVNLHYQLSQYMFSTLVDAHLHGGSMMRNISKEQRSHTVGNDIFFKAITSDTNTVRFTLPAEGMWIDFWTDKEYPGGSDITGEYPLARAPIFIRKGAIIPMEINNGVTGIGDRSCSGKITLLIYPGKKRSFLFHRATGEGTDYEDIHITCKRGKISINSKKDHDYVFLVKTTETPEKVSGSDHWKFHPEKRYLQIEKTGRTFNINIQ